MRPFLDAHPGLVLWVPLALLVSTGGAVLVARRTRVRAVPAGLLLAAWLLPLALTLTPTRSGGAGDPRECTTVLRPYGWWGQGGEELANLGMLLPLGLLAPLLLGRRSVPLLLAAALLPPALEATQFLLPALGRSCDVLDVLLNGLGLLAGFLVGLLALLLLRATRLTRAGAAPS